MRGKQLFSGNISHLKLTIIFLLLSVIWASDFVVIKLGLGVSPPLIFAGLRYFLAGIVLLLMMIARRNFHFTSLREALISILLGVLATMEFGFLYFGMQYTGAGVASLLFNTQPIMVAVLAIAFLKEALTKNKIFANVFGFLGICLIFAGNLSDWLINLGGFFVLLGAFSWAVGTIVFKLARIENLLSATSLMLLTCGTFLLVIGAFFEANFHLGMTLKFALILIYLATICSAFGITVWFHLLKRYEVSQLSPYLFLVPAFGVFLGWLLLSEKMYLNEVIGIFCVGLSIYLLGKEKVV